MHCLPSRGMLLLLQTYFFQFYLYLSVSPLQSFLFFFISSHVLRFVLDTSYFIVWNGLYCMWGWEKLSYLVLSGRGDWKDLFQWNMRSYKYHQDAISPSGAPRPGPLIFDVCVCVCVVCVWCVRACLCVVCMRWDSVEKLGSGLSSQVHGNMIVFV